MRKLKKGSVIGGVVLGLALTGYGAWCIYKKCCPEDAYDMKNDMKKGMKKMKKDVEKSIENMM